MTAVIEGLDDDTQSLERWAEEVDGMAFLLDGLISTDTTVWFGHPKVGKSRLVAGLVAALAEGRPFLGREADRPLDRILICCADTGGHAEYVERIASALDDPSTMKSIFMRSMPAANSPEAWREFRRQVNDFAPDLLIVDPLTNVVAGEFNDGAAVRKVFTGVTGVKAPILFVGHASNKPGEFGERKATLPMGSTVIVSSVRWLVAVNGSSSRPGVLELDAFGNRGRPLSIQAKSSGEYGCGFEVAEELSADDLESEAVGRRRVADERDLEIAQWVVERVKPGVSNREVAEAVAEAFPAYSRGAKSRVGAIAKMFSANPRRGFARFLERGEGGRLRLVGQATP